MSNSLSEFDGFLKKFREISGDPLLDYWSDAIFVTRWLCCPLVEKRFKGGMGLWLVWALQKVLQTAGNPPSTPSSMRDGNLTDGYRLLPTPAHHESLVPLLAQAEPDSIRIFGEIHDDLSHQSHVTIGFHSSLACLGRRVRLRALLRAIRAHRQIVRILSKCELSVSPPTKDFHVRLLEQMFTTELELLKLRKTELPLRSLLLTYELAADSKALVLWARETHARVIHVMHGQRLPTYQVTQATDLVLFSKLDEPWFRARVGPEVRLWSIGHPRLEMLHQSVPAQPPRKGRTQPRIAFFSQPAEGDYTQEMRTADWQILTFLRGKAEVRFRLHPRENRDAAFLALRRSSLEFVELSEEGLQEDLAWCDAIASSWSTVSMEAAACGRGVFWTCATPERYEASQELRDHGIGVLIQTPEQWKPYLAAWNTGPWQAPVVVPDEHLHQLGMIGDMEKRWMDRLAVPAQAMK